MLKLADSSWIYEANRRIAMNYGTINQFASDNNLSFSACQQFIIGNPLPKNDFLAICNVVDFDWEEVSEDS